MQGRKKRGRWVFEKKKKEIIMQGRNSMWIKKKLEKENYNKIKKKVGGGRWVFEKWGKYRESK